MGSLVAETLREWTDEGIQHLYSVQVAQNNPYLDTCGCHRCKHYLEKGFAASSVIAEMQRRGFETTEKPSTLPEFWQNRPNEAVVSAYKNLSAYDVISQELIIAEIKNRRLEMDAASYKKETTHPPVSADMPFLKVLLMVFKFTVASIIVALPFWLLYFMVASSL